MFGAKFLRLIASSALIVLPQAQGFSGKLTALAGLAYVITSARACEGPEGPQGEVGPQGPDGPMGAAGPAGPAGVDANNTLVEKLSADLAAALQRIETLEMEAANSVQFRHSARLYELYSTFVNNVTFDDATLKTWVGDLECIQLHVGERGGWEGCTVPRLHSIGIC